MDGRRRSPRRRHLDVDPADLQRGGEEVSEKVEQRLHEIVELIKRAVPVTDFGEMLGLFEEAMQVAAEAEREHCAEVAERGARFGDSPAGIAEAIRARVTRTHPTHLERVAGDLDLELLAKLAAGEGGRRTGALKRAGLLEWHVTDAGLAALAAAGYDGGKR